jgi:hypothetical protein
MNTHLIDAIAKAVLYEGYMLYPYRPSSVKNRQRFNFGVLYPRLYSEAQAGSDAWMMQTECLVEGTSPAMETAIETPAIEVRVRFLKLVARISRDITERTSPPWQEAIECEVVIPPQNLDALATAPLQWDFTFPAIQESEDLRDEKGEIAGRIDRMQQSIRGTVLLNATRVADDLFKLQVQVKNLTPLENTPGQTSRDLALMKSLVSAHTLLGMVNGQFVSLLEPPENLKDLAASCENVGAWPVLVGAEGQRDTMLASPIILYDYPQIAPESPGDLFDGTEIDEILALRIMTMTDDEKREMRSTDDRARKILERTEALPVELLARLHGTLRELRSLKEETS